jgi:hypothetical protein
MFRGGAVVRGALLLALIGICFVALGGCQQPKPNAMRLGYVRIEALLPLHPLWKQVEIQQQQAMRLAAMQPRPDGIELTLPGLPSNFAPPQKVPPSLMSERQHRLQEEAARYVDSYSEQLTARNNAIFQQEAKTERATMEATYAHQLDARKRELQAIADAKAKVLLAEREKRLFRLVALQSQIKVYSGQAHDDASLQRVRVRAEVAQLDQQRVTLLASVDPQAIAEMAPVRKQLESDLENRLAARRKQLDQETKDLTAQELARLSKLPDPIPPIGSTLPPARYMQETPLPLPTPRQTLLAIQTAQAGVDSAARQQQTMWRAQNDRLVAAIRLDLQLAVQQWAHEQGMRIVPLGTRGAMDATAAAAAAIRDQWRTR